MFVWASLNIYSSGYKNKTKQNHQKTPNQKPNPKQAPKQKQTNCTEKRNLPDFPCFHEKQGESNPLHCSHVFRLPRQCYTEIPQFVYLKKGTHLGWQITCRHWGGTVEEEPRGAGGACSPHGHWISGVQREAQLRWGSASSQPSARPANRSGVGELALSLHLLKKMELCKLKAEWNCKGGNSAPIGYVFTVLNGQKERGVVVVLFFLLSWGCCSGSVLLCVAQQACDAASVSGEAWQFPGKIEYLLMCSVVLDKLQNAELLHIVPQLLLSGSQPRRRLLKLVVVTARMGWIIHCSHWLLHNWFIYCPLGCVSHLILHRFPREVQLLAICSPKKCLEKGSFPSS